ncbi:MAG: 5-methyltetrahydropteroyltriglutamate--homocysteine S-methyltransferase [Lachnospiraceae bacterium]|nr:5-methyltetrahydropteroyltriglutamate--homocysteine S-methyltransferase [Lachnospiraceae bacterium]
MDYTIVGFPRLGEQRELKRATESYWKGDISREQFLDDVKEQQVKQWKEQMKRGLKQIPVGDFSLYDMVLDAAFLIGAVPKKYKELKLNPVDIYFAAARGYQGKEGDVKALTMKKWFNTNYHYMVPELDDDNQFALNFGRLSESIILAKDNGFNVRPVVIGPFTFLKLCRIKGSRVFEEYVTEVTSVYKDLIQKIGDIHDGWIQFDEPYLVRDLTADDVSVFVKIYTELLADKKNKVLLQTYFGDVRDCYKEIISLPFDGIGLDFVEGKKTAELIEKNGFPEEKLLFAGIVNGKNVWRSDYSEKLKILDEVKKKTKNIVLSTSCSLLHVPYTIAHETKLGEEVTSQFAFAYEKIEELLELAKLSTLDSYDGEKEYIKNRTICDKRVLRTEKSVQERVDALSDSDFHRMEPRKERQELQRKVLSQGLLPTTTIGSFPQTAEVKQNRSRFRKGEITKEEYDARVNEFIKQCIDFQDKIGLDVLVHGEFERNDMVEYFGENLSGFVFTENAWVQSYGTRGLKPPIVFGDIKREKPFTVAYIKYANSLTSKDVKGMLTGPVTILNWSFPREDISIKETMYQIALALQDEVLDLEKAGVRIIQIDEAALREKLPLRRDDWYEDYLDFAIPAFRLTNSKVKPETQIHTHMCYSEFEDIIPAIDDMDADVITFEASRSQLTILDSLKKNNFETEVGPGVYDIHSPRVPGVEEIKMAIRQMLEKIPKENLWINPDCGLKTRGNEETEKSLINLVQAAKEIRAEV